MKSCPLDGPPTSESESTSCSSPALLPTTEMRETLERILEDGAQWEAGGKPRKHGVMENLTEKSGKVTSDVLGIPWISWIN